MFFLFFRNHYIQHADFVAGELEEEVERVLVQQAKETCQLLIGEKFQVRSTTKTNKWVIEYELEAIDLTQRQDSDS